jgi:1-acyl-sn-glycerol-3-phosphate acyltransferase
MIRMHLIRWMMATETMSPSLNWLWALGQVIPVDRDGKDSAALREAVRHVKKGGILGVFPEGRITDPPREVRPFLPGVGFIIAKTKAPVLVAWVTGTPDTPDMNEALMTRSHGRVEFLDVMRFDEGAKPEAITEALRMKIAQRSGWPLNDEVIPPGGHPGR